MTDPLLEAFGSIGSDMLTRRATFLRAPEHLDGVTQSKSAYLTDVPCMPVTGNTTRQSGLTMITIQGSLPAEGKNTAIDITPEVRAYLDAGNHIENDDRVLIDGIEYIVFGTDEFDAPELGVAFIILKLKEEQ